MNSNRTSGYVFSNDFRFIHYGLIPFCIVSLFLILCVTIKQGLVQSHDAIIYALSAFLVCCLNLLLLNYSLQYSRLARIRFDANSHLVSNHYGKSECHVTTEKPLFISEVSVSFSVKGGIWIEKYWAMSNQPFPQIRYVRKDGLFLVKVFHLKNIVIIPENEQTVYWMKQVVGISQVPQFPKVAYYQ